MHVHKSFSGERYKFNDVLMTKQRCLLKL